MPQLAGHFGRIMIRRDLQPRNSGGRELGAAQPSQRSRLCPPECLFWTCHLPVDQSRLAAARTETALHRTEMYHSSALDDSRERSRSRKTDLLKTMDRDTVSNREHLISPNPCIACDSSFTLVPFFFWKRAREPASFRSSLIPVR